MKAIEPKKGTELEKMLKLMRRKKGATVREGLAFSNSPTKLISDLGKMGHKIVKDWEYKYDGKKVVKRWKRYWAA